jgi:3-oxoisoapionate decarboxylase
MQLGLGSYAYAWAIGVPEHAPARPLDAFGLLDEAQRLGVELVQFCDNLPLTALAPAQLEEFHERARGHGLSIEVGTRGLEVENLRAHVGLARRFGCPFVRVVIDRPGDEPSAEEALERMRQVLPEFERAGLRLAIENHDRFPSRTLAWMVEKLGPARAGICLDTVNSFGALEGPEVVVDVLGQYTLCLHIKDFIIRRAGYQGGFVVEGCPAGQGRLDIPWLLKRLKSCPEDFNVVLESWVPRGDSLDETIARERAWAEQSVQFMRKVGMD